MGRVFTNGFWIAKAGREDEFVSAWNELAAWVVATFPDAAPQLLFRDLDNRSRFVVLDEWNSTEAVLECRRHPEFRRRLAELLSGPVESLEGTMLEAIRLS